jgi:hypothetical protein
VAFHSHIPTNPYSYLHLWAYINSRLANGLWESFHQQPFSLSFFSLLSFLPLEQLLLINRHNLSQYAHVVLDQLNKAFPISSACRVQRHCILCAITLEFQHYPMCTQPSSLIIAFFQMLFLQPHFMPLHSLASSFSSSSSSSTSFRNLISLIPLFSHIPSPHTHTHTQTTTTYFLSSNYLL